MRLTFLWADEAVAVKDYQAKFSQQLVDWADAFYRQYGFELDVVPKPGGKIQEAYRHCLTKSDGYAPDIVSFEEFWQRMDKVERPIEIEIGELAEMFTVVLIPQQAEKLQEIDAEMAKFNLLPNSQWDPVIARLKALFLELKEIEDKIKANTQRREVLRSQLDAHREKHQQEIIDRNFDFPVRALLGRKIVASMSLQGLVPVKTGNENAAITDPYRLKVLFCRFSLSPGVLSLARSSAPFGITRPASGVNSIAGHFLFDGRFILINVNRFEQITLAHEMLHAAGRWHLQGQHEKMKKIQQWIRTIRADPITGKVVIPPIMETVDGGYVDGPDDDIMNYEAKGRRPEEVKLYNVPLMENAYFVQDPATAVLPEGSGGP